MPDFDGGAGAGQESIEDLADTYHLARADVVEPTGGLLGGDESVGPNGVSHVAKVSLRLQIPDTEQGLLWPASMTAIWRAKLEVAKTGLWRGPV